LVRRESARTRLRHTIGNAKELSSEERSALLAFIQHRYTHPSNGHNKEMYEDLTATDLRKWVPRTRIEFVDLNGDGANEIVLQGYGIGPCGATGNCILIVLQRSGSGWKTLLDTHEQFGGGFEKIRLLETSTNGYRDIVVAAHDSAVERTAFVLDYDGKRYRERECYAISWFAAGGSQRLHKPSVGPCPK
jgi:hypothetical protein